MRETGSSSFAGESWYSHNFDISWLRFICSSMRDKLSQLFIKLSISNVLLCFILHPRHNGLKNQLQFVLAYKINVLEKGSKRKEKVTILFCIEPAMQVSKSVA
jgi:hypothetical protein